MKNSIRSASAIQSPWKIQTIPIYKHREDMHCATANQHLGLSAKRNGTQRRTKVCVYIVHTVVCQKAHLQIKQCQTVKN